MAKKFVRTDSTRYSRLGRKRKALQKWRKPKGRDNKIREKRFSYPSSPTVGHKSPKKESGKISGKKVLLVQNLKDLENADKDCVVIVARVGAKKKMEIMKVASEKKIDIINVKGENKK